MLFAVVIALILTALAFDFINGFHDAANSIATVVSTRVLSPLVAVAWAAFFNFISAMPVLWGAELKVAATMGKGIVEFPALQARGPEFVLIFIFAALLGAIVWNLLTWWWGLPSSSSHALAGGMIGAGLVALGPGGLIGGGIWKIVLFIVLSPVIGMVLGSSMMLLTVRTIGRGLPWVVRLSPLLVVGIGLSTGWIAAPRTWVGWAIYSVVAIGGSAALLLLSGRLAASKTPAQVDRLFRKLQLVSAAIFSYSHGTNDAQKVMGIITVILYGTIWSDRVVPDGHFPVPFWVVLSCHAAIGLGTMFGGWRIVKTMGHNLTKLQPFGGFCAETGGGVTILALAAAGIPVSTTHTITGAIVGVGATKGTRAVRWGVAGRIIWAWIFTIPASAIVAAAVFGLVRLATALLG